MSSRITPIDWKTLVKVFEAFGCQYKRKHGSHHILSYPGAKRAVVIPEYEKII
jgi:predicted RNA binding protein YcfA (HicA-like mRNA interferase family)